MYCEEREYIKTDTKSFRMYCENIEWKIRPFKQSLYWFKYWFNFCKALSMQLLAPHFPNVRYIYYKKFNLLT